MQKKKRKSLEDMTMKDDFMFGAVMTKPDICREFLELVLQTPIEQVLVDKEKSIVYHPEYHGIRLDVFAREIGGKLRHFNVEMQTETTAIGLRSRYYESQMDMDMLQKGVPYSELPDSYVIFVCDYDPIGKGYFKYNLRTCCDEVPEYEAGDGRHLILLNASGRVQENGQEELAKVLQYIHADLKESQRDYDSSFVKKLQKTVHETKCDRQMGERYMKLQLLLDDIRREGRAEGRAEEKANTIKRNVEALCESLHISEEEAMNYLKLSEEDRALLKNMAQ